MFQPTYLKGRYIVTSGNVSYIKSYVNANLSGFKPDIEHRVGKTLLALLKVRNLEDFPLRSMTVLTELEKDINRNSPSQISLLGTLNAVVGAFPQLTDDEVKIIKEYLNSLLIKRDDTLKQFMAKEFKSKTKEIHDPDEVSPENKMKVVMGVMRNSGNIEDFKFKSAEKISESKIAEVIMRYYSDRGYSITDIEQGVFSAEKEDRDITITISDSDNMPMVSENTWMISVIPMPSRTPVH